MKKAALLGLLLVNLFFLFPATAVAATEPAATPGVLLDEAGLDEVEETVGNLETEMKRALPVADFRTLVLNLLKGEVGYKPGDILAAVFRYLFREVVGNAALLGKLVVLAIICAVLHNASTAFEKSTTSSLAYVATYLAMFTVALGSFTVALDAGRDAVDNMAVFVQALLPVMVTLLCAVGGMASAALLHPIILMVIAGAGTIIKNVVFPIIFFAAVLGMISHLATGFSISRLADFLRQVGLGIMGVLTTVFLGVLTIQGVAGAVTQGIAFRTAKYATQTFVPVVGRLFADAMEAVAGSSLLIKNAVGLGGLLFVFLLALFPLLKILALVFIYKLAAALVQPVGETRLADCLGTLGNGMVAVFAVVATSALLFFFALAVVCGMGNLTVMLR